MHSSSAPGIAEMLKALEAGDYEMYVVTAKPRV